MISNEQTATGIN